MGQHKMVVIDCSEKQKNDNEHRRNDKGCVELVPHQDCEQCAGNRTNGFTPLKLCLGLVFPETFLDMCRYIALQANSSQRHDHQSYLVDPTILRNKQTETADD